MSKEHLLDERLGDFMSTQQKSMLWEPFWLRQLFHKENHFVAYKDDQNCENNKNQTCRALKWLAKADVLNEIENKLNTNLDMGIDEGQVKNNRDKFGENVVDIFVRITGMNIAQELSIGIHLNFFLIFMAIFNFFYHAKNHLNP